MAQNHIVGAGKAAESLPMPLDSCICTPAEVERLCKLAVTVLVTATTGMDADTAQELPSRTVPRVIFVPMFQQRHVLGVAPLFIHLAWCHPRFDSASSGGAQFPFDWSIALSVCMLTQG